MDIFPPAVLAILVGRTDQAISFSCLVLLDNGSRSAWRSPVWASLTGPASVTKTTDDRAAGSTLVPFGAMPVGVYLLHSRQRPGVMAVASRAVDRTDDALFVRSNSTLACGVYLLSDTCLIERIVA